MGMSYSYASSPSFCPSSKFLKFYAQNNLEGSTLQCFYYGCYGVFSKVKVNHMSLQCLVSYLVLTYMLYIFYVKQLYCMPTGYINYAMGFSPKVQVITTYRVSGPNWSSGFQFKIVSKTHHITCCECSFLPQYWVEFKFPLG